MAGRLSNLGASASSSSSSKKTVKLEKRKRCATIPEEPKPKPRPPFQLITTAAAGTGTARPSASATAGAVVPPFHLHHRAVATNSATPTAAAFPFPVAGVSGAAPLWTTAAMLASRSAAAAAAPSPPPPVVVMAGGQQPVPMPFHFVGYHHHPGGLPPPPPPPPPPAAVGVGIPLAAALDSIENLTLGRMLSALTPICHPPLRAHKKSGGAPPPPWWPTGSEHWWAPDLLAHLDANVAAAAALTPVPPTSTPVVPFRPGYSLRKAHKVAVLVAVVKHLAPDFARVAAAVRHSGKLSASEAALWHRGLANERAKCIRPVFFLLPQHQHQHQHQQGGGGAGTGSAVVVHGGSSSASDDGGDGEKVGNLPVVVPAGDSVSKPADDSGCEAMPAAAAEIVEKEKENDGGGCGGGVSAGDAPAGGGRENLYQQPGAGDGRDQQPVNISACDDDDGGHVGQVVAGEPEQEMMQQQPEQEQHGDIQDGNGNGNDVAAAAEVQVHVDPVVDDVDAPNDTNDVPNAVAGMEEEALAPEEGGHHCWYSTEELNHMFAEFESFGDVWY